MMSTGVCRWLFLLISLSTWTTISSSKEMRVVCYYTNWSVYRPGAAKFSPQNINPYLCTHLIYAFGGFTKENTLKPFDKYQDIEKGGYAKFTGLKTYNKNLKTMLAIGGWNEGSTRFSPMVASADRRKELVRNTIKFLRQNHFDGLDLDWEYPTFRDGGKPRDRDNYAQLVEELREEFERESEKTGRTRLLLTMAVPAGIEYINKGYDVPKLMKYLDWMNILSYDYHSAFEPAVNHHAPLFALEEDNEYNYDAELNIDYTIKHYLKLGADPYKLVLGIPTYGRSYTLYNPEAYEMGAPADGPGDMGEATRENGYLAYYEICEYVKNQDWTVEQPNPTAMGPYAYKENQWVGYDDENIVRKKSEYVAENGLGGIMFWAIDNDDFRGDCHGKPYPLIEAAKEALLEAYGITDDNLISPPTKLKSRTRTRTKAAGKTKSNDDEDTKVEKISNSGGGSRRRNRPKSKSKEENRESGGSRPKLRRKELRATTEPSTTHSSLKLVTPSYTTPAPPSTPELDGAFKCEDEGFFPHPKDCKKYFWCLSGAGDSGIVAHQFTCPAGLYFNKAADSCDYTQNVLCNKKLQRPTSTTTASSASLSTTATTPSALFSTSRAPPKITAATSKTTLKVSTTTEAYEDEYEYEDDDEERDEEDIKGKIDSEEDPRVIKELIELIKKAGGIAELERQLSGSKLDAATSPTSDPTTPSAISKSLYERVLNKAVKNSLNSRKNSLTTLRNSRGPQSDQTNEKDESPSSRSKTDRGKLQYTSISRNRPSTEKSVDDEEDVEEDKEIKEDNTKTRRISSKKFQPEYVTIRRPRVSTTTEASESDSSLDRNRILGETSDEEYDDDETIDDENGEVGEEDGPNKKQYTPQYVNIRRQRPSTTEESATSKYAVIRRGSTSTTESVTETDEASTSSKYKTIRRGSTPGPATTTEQEASSKFQLRRGTTQTVTTTPAAVSDGATSRFKNFRRGSTTSRPTSQIKNTTSPSTTENNVTTPAEDENDVTPRSSTVPQSSTGSIYSNTSKYQTLSRSSTTTEPESDETPTISASITLASTESPSTPVGIAAVTTSNVEDKTTTLANVIDDATEIPTTLKIKVDITDTKKLSETEKPEVSTGTLQNASSPAAEEITDNETGTSQKNHPQLLDPRPFSVLSRGSSTTVKPITESTVENSKVSQTNFKFRPRPKASDSDEISRVQTASSESPITKNNHRFRSRGGSRFNSNNQNANNNPNDENSEEDINSKVKLRKRIFTTEKIVEENRTYRPSDLADFSSLTAVDFPKIKELNVGRSTHRRRGRPNISTTTAATAEDLTEEVANESLKTSSRTLPLARKLVEASAFGANRRIFPKKIDQINASSEINTTKRIRGFSRTTRQPSTTESSDANASTSSNTVSVTPRSRRVVRRYRTTTTKPIADKDVNSSAKLTDEQQVPRRGSFTTKNGNQIDNTDNSTVIATNLNNRQNPLQRLFIKKPTRLPFVIQRNDVDEENDDSAEDSSTEEDENIKLSESNIRENSDVNNYDVGGKPNRRIFKLIRPKSDILHGKSNSDKGYVETVSVTKEDPTDSITEKVTEDKSLETKILPGEVTTTTETNIAQTTRENIKINTNSTSTLPTIRTRKIIRKVKPASTTVVADTTTTTTESTIGRRRKIIRRLRPASSVKQSLETSNSNINNQTKTAQSFIRSRIKPSQRNISQTETHESSKHIFRPSVTRRKNKYTKPDFEKEVTTETNIALNSPVKISHPTLPDRNINPTQVIEDNESVTDVAAVKEDYTKHIFRPKLFELRNKNKDLENNKSDAEENRKRISYKPFVRSTTTTKNEHIIESVTENANNNSEQIGVNTEINDGKLTEKPSGGFENLPTVENILDFVTEKLIATTTESDLSNMDDDSRNNIHETSTETSTILNNLTINIKNDDYDTNNSPNGKSTTTEENLTNVADGVTESNTVTKFTESPDTFNETTINQDKFETRSSTIVYNHQNSPSYPTKENEQNDDDIEESTVEEPEEETGEKNRKYVSVYRSSTRSNSFKDFNSEINEETPKFDDIFEDKLNHKELYDNDFKFHVQHKENKDNHKDTYDEDFKFDSYGEQKENTHSIKDPYEDDFKFGNHKEFSGYKYDDDDDDYYKYDDDRLLGDTSTEFGSVFSSSPNLISNEDKTEVQPATPETSSQRNHLYHPHRPAFVRPKFTFSTTERQTPETPKYKTFSRMSTKSLRKETIQIHSFNNTDPDGDPEKAVNTVLFTNRFDYNTPEVVKLGTSNNTSLEEDLFSEGTTMSMNVLDTEENTITTQSTESKFVYDSTTEKSILADITLNEESTVSDVNLETYITTQQYNNDVNNIFDFTIAANDNSTVEPEKSTMTDNIPQTETILNAFESNTANSVIVLDQNEQSNSSTDNYLEAIDSTTDVLPTTINNLLTSDSSQTNLGSFTTVPPETTTPYRRKSTLRPLNARPKFTPIRRKNTFITASTTEQNDEGFKPKKFLRNRYQKLTTESILPSSSDILVSSKNPEKSSTPIPINKFLYKYSTTRKSDIVQKESDTQSGDGEDETVINEEMSDHSPDGSSELIKEVNNLLATTSAVPISEFVLSHSTTEINDVNMKETGNEEVSNQEDDVENQENITQDIKDEEEVEENVGDKPTPITSSETAIITHNFRPQLVKPYRISNTPTSKRRPPNSPTSGNNPLSSGRSTTARVVNRPFFGKSTEASKTEDLSDIDTEAVKNRNKNLFSKHRKTNSPVSAVSIGSSEQPAVEETTNVVSILDATTSPQDFITVSPSVTESVTKANNIETTEYLTTLHHIFAQVNDNETTNNLETTTESLNSAVTSTTGKIERLIEVNRIVQVQTKEAKLKNHVIEEQPTEEIVHPVLDKIGEINRVTVIKIVDGNETVIETVSSHDNEIKQTGPISPVYIPQRTTTAKAEAVPPILPFFELPAKVEEIPAHNIQGNINVTNITVTIDRLPQLLQSHREDRKFEIFSKSNDLNNNNQIGEKKAEVVEGISHINVITPRPIFTEASTIALEGLFLTDSGQTISSPKPFNTASYDEVLETEHSKFVNVRVLHPDENFGKETRDKSKLLPIKLLKQDEHEVTLNAKVVEVKAKSGLESIRIVPIKVEMSKRITNNLPLLRVSPQLTNFEYT